MKILVMSDSHGYNTRMENIIFDNQDADTIIFLGDGLDHFEDVSYIFDGFANKRIIAVMGNCDSLFHRKESTVLAEFGKFKFYVTHGKEQDVKRGTERLISDMKEKNCNVGLFGHTHIQFSEKKQGCYLFNPGSVSDGKYGIITIDETGEKIEFKLCN